MKSLIIKSNKSTLRLALLIALCVFGIASFSSASAYESKLYFSNEKIDTKNNILEVSVMVNSDKYINASESYIKFNNGGSLEVESISTDKSIFDLWIKYPKYSKQKNSIYFAGGTTTAFVGRGELFKIRFKIKDINNIQNIKLDFSKSLILAYDGRGTNIITSSEGKRLEKIPSYVISMK